MFLAVGSIYVGLGHDRVTGLRGAAQALPLSILTFAIGGLALMGVQPSGAALAKELLLQETARTAQWWWAIVLQAGGMLTAAYVVLVLANALAPSVQPLTPAGPPRRGRDLAALALALLSLSLGLLPWQPYLPIPHDFEFRLFGVDGLVKLLWPVLGGAVLAVAVRSMAASADIFSGLEDADEPDRTVAADLSCDRQQGRKRRRCPSTMVRSGHLAAPARAGLRRADVRRKVSIPASGSCSPTGPGDRPGP